MIAKVFGTAAAAALLVLGVSCSHFSNRNSGTQASNGSSTQASTSSASTSASAGGTGASGPAEMGRGRCEALVGAERDRCFAEDRQRSDARK
jgi:hypothetical protein